jgi:hypothetical protein
MDYIYDEERGDCPEADWGQKASAVIGFMKARDIAEKA